MKEWEASGLDVAEIQTWCDYGCGYADQAKLLTYYGVSAADCSVSLREHYGHDFDGDDTPYTLMDDGVVGPDTASGLALLIRDGIPDEYRNIPMLADIIRDVESSDVESKERDAILAMARIIGGSARPTLET